MPIRVKNYEETKMSETFEVILQKHKYITEEEKKEKGFKLERNVRAVNKN